MAAFTPLTSIATVKAILSITTSNSDAVLTGIVNAVSATISQYCNRNFLSASYTETYNGIGGTSLLLRQRPIQSVSSLNINGVVIPSRPQVNAFGFSFDENRLYLSGSAFWPGQQNVVISYTAGLPTISAAALPDLWQAAAEWAAQVYQSDTKHIDQGSVSAGEGQSTVFLKDMPWYVRRAADPYRHIAPQGQVLGV